MEGMDNLITPSDWLSVDSIIKVVGVGGGGCNAVDYMYRQRIEGCTFIVCNTDSQALDNSDVPVKIQLGSGLGAGCDPTKGRNAALDSQDTIADKVLENTEMLFITAGMGGGTGTGAAPIIARCAKEAGILTVGIVTIPFKFEGMPKINQALDGVEEISKHVDALLVINNERLREIYPELTVINAFAKADDTLTIAAKSIAEIITMHGIMNLDFEDVTTVLKDGGVAIMSTGYGEGEGRVTKALTEALTSPLLNHNDIFNSKKVLLNINFCADDEHSSLMMEEMNEIHEFMGKFRHDVETKWGLATDSTLGDKVKITLLATGFGLQAINGMSSHQEEKKEKLSAEDKERKANRDELIDIYYERDNKTSKHRHNNIFIYSAENMDNDNIIARIDESPTYSRTKEDLNRLKNEAAG
mgnify:CR=1 FL=1